MVLEESKPKISFTYFHLLIISILVGSFLRFYDIGKQPFWIDEAYSDWFSNLPILDLWTVVPRFETNPPFYYTILKIWKSVFGSSEAGLRSLSALVSIGCIPLVFITGRLVGKPSEGNWLGAIAALMFSISPVHIQYAQEARSFSMLTFAAVLVLCTFLWLIRHPAEACKPIIRKLSGPKTSLRSGIGHSSFFLWTTVIIAIACTLWLHNTSILYVFALFSIMLAWFFLQLRFDKGFLGNMLVVAVSVFLLWGPYLIFLVPQARGATFPSDTISVLSTIDTIIWLLFGGSILWKTETGQTYPFVLQMVKMLAFTFLIALAATGLQNIRKSSGKYAFILILGAILGPIVMELLWSLVGSPIFLARTLVYVSVPFYIAVASEVLMLRGSRKRILSILVISLIFLKGTHSYYAREKEPWDKIVQIVTQQAKHDAVLVVPNYIEFPFSYYASRMGNNDVKISPLPYPMSYFLHSTFGPGSSSIDLYHTQQITPRDIPAIDKAISQKSPVWYVVRGECLYDKDRIVFNELRKTRNLIAQWHFGEWNHIGVFKFVRK